MTCDKKEIKELVISRGLAVDVLNKVAGIPIDVLDGKHHPCPKCGGKDRFRLIDRAEGAVYCNQCFNENNGDFLSAVQHFQNISFSEAVNKTAECLGVDKNDGFEITNDSPSRGERFHKPKADKVVDTVSAKTTPSDNPECWSRWVKEVKHFGEITKGYTLPVPPTNAEAVYLYPKRDEDNLLFSGCIYRIKTERGKSFYQYHSCDNKTWFKGLPQYKSYMPCLYGQERFNDSNVFRVVEGEKCADSLNEIHKARFGSSPIVATTISGGSHCWKHLGEFAESFKDGVVELIPDRDKAGIEALKEAVKSLLPLIECGKIASLHVFILDKKADGSENRPEDKYDIADYIDDLRKDGKQDSQIGELVNEMIEDNLVPIRTADDLEQKILSLGGDVGDDSTAEDGYQKELVLTLSRDVGIEKTDWFWKNKFPQGVLNLCVGKGSAGKSSFLMWLSAMVTRGECFPDGEHCQKGFVIYFFSEDDPARTLNPRFLANGGDGNFLAFVQCVRSKGKGNVDITQEKQFSLEDLDALENATKQIEKEYGEGFPIMVVIDPLTGFLGNAKRNDGGEVRSILSRLEKDFLINHRNVTVFGIAHTKKGTDLFGSVAEETLGSVEFVNVARTVLLFYQDKDDPKTRYGLFAKNNLVNGVPTGFQFTLNNRELDSPDGIIEAPQVEIVDCSCEMSADEYREDSIRRTNERLRGKSRNNGGRPRKGEEADLSSVERWLLKFLRDKPMPVGDAKNPEDGTVFGEGKKAGLGINRIRNANNRLGVLSDKIYEADGDNRYYWHLP